MKNSNYLMKKSLLVLITAGSILLYLPINRLITDGYELQLAIDDRIPLLPVFAIPYLCAFAYWLLTIIFINDTQPKNIINRFNLIIILASVLSCLIYVFIPTYVTRPIITQTDIYSQILNWIYTNDHIYNAAPSGHTFYTIICSWALWKAIPKLKLIWLLLAILIISSTTLTKQHNFLDIFSGGIFAWLIILLSAKLTTKK
ncbi:MAG: phosphatase PAP2 family protein [bacterium]